MLEAALDLLGQERAEHEVVAGQAALVENKQPSRHTAGMKPERQE